MLHQVLVQSIGIIATVISLSVFQVNKRKTMLILSFSAALLWATHYYMLGAITGAVLNLLGALRWYVFGRITPSRSNIWVLYVFVALSIAAVLLSHHSLIGFLPMTATIISSVAFWQKKPKLIRRLTLASNPLWLVYNASVGSYIGVVVEVLLIVSNIVGQYRFDFVRKFQPVKR
jgi:Bacterial inner membrane protein